MFGKEIVEFCTLAAYWVLFMPFLLTSIDPDYKENPLDYFYRNSKIFLYLIAGYLVTFRIIMLIFIQLKSLDLHIWNRLPTEKAQLSLELEEKKAELRNLDTVDGPSSSSRIPRKLSSPLYYDNNLSIIEVHEKQKKNKSVK